MVEPVGSDLLMGMTSFFSDTSFAKLYDLHFGQQRTLSTLGIHWWLHFEQVSWFVILQHPPLSNKRGKYDQSSHIDIYFSSLVETLLLAFHMDKSHKHNKVSFYLCSLSIKTFYLTTCSFCFNINWKFIMIEHF